jgi:hypothetical protein
MSKIANQRSDPPVILSLVDTSKSTMRMLFEVWYALWHEAHH